MTTPDFRETIETGDRPAQLAALRVVLLDRLEIAVGRDVAMISRELRELLGEIHPDGLGVTSDLSLLRDRLAAEVVESGPRDVPAVARELRGVVKDLEAAGAGIDPSSVSDRVAEQRRNRRTAPANVLSPAVGF